MTTPEIRPLSELNERAQRALVRKLGVVDALRFLSQFRSRTGNYTHERGQWLDELSLPEIISEIKARRPG